MKVLLGVLNIMAIVVYGIIILSLATAAPLLLGYNPVIILSGSMEPSYPVGGITYYKQAQFAEIAVGDVITFALGTDSLATHRVVEIDTQTQSFTTKGDSNETNDANNVSYTTVQGKTIDFAIPFMGYFVSYVQNLYVIIACGAILVLDIFLSKDDKKKSA